MYDEEQLVELQLRTAVQTAGVNCVTPQRRKQTSPKGTQAAMSCARYAKWPFHSGKASAGTPMTKSVCGTSKNMQSIWRETRGEGGEMVRNLENMTSWKRLEAFSLLIKNENMLRKDKITFFMQAERSCKEVINCSTHPMVKTVQKKMLRDIKTNFLKKWVWAIPGCGIFFVGNFQGHIRETSAWFGPALEQGKGSWPFKVSSGHNTSITVSSWMQMATDPLWWAETSTVLIKS